MHFDVDAVPSDEFSSWAAQTKAGNTKLDEQSYRDLTEQTIPQTPFTYSAVDPLLFGKITGQNLPPVKVPGTRKA